MTITNVDDDGYIEVIIYDIDEEKVAQFKVKSFHTEILMPQSRSILEPDPSLNPLKAKRYTGNINPNVRKMWVISDASRQDYEEFLSQFKESHLSSYIIDLLSIQGPYFKCATEKFFDPDFKSIKNDFVYIVPSLQLFDLEEVDTSCELSSS